MDVESLKEVIPIASTQNKPKGRRNSIVLYTRQIKNAQQAHDAQKNFPGMVKRYLATRANFLMVG